MDALITGVVVLFSLFMPVRCSDGFFTDPVICYFLDAFLMVYCIAVTALFFREKFSKMKFAPPESEDKGGIYQELERPDADPYQQIHPKKAKKKTDKKRPKGNPERSAPV
ncbi:T-cell surface glycoprotein CD3 zeta chain-like [Cyprinodon tularosa]|uniref:T-cell surface glycoprotein CD3 zeta chain-like n=1 Tax=Cyprinodon variegatus TaxID=28743 RepID=A0A3Q2G1E5_CYPVA|nr:PREDICTED: T-cell surface glycoprotein CD3 zeta chain-like [Cyprinodon variegatus]XP_038145652.1 T-cell surface glycoprotein CD3 zeta chain-like [Cyprinodon tularosa]